MARAGAERDGWGRQGGPGAGAGRPRPWPARAVVWAIGGWLGLVGYVVAFDRAAARRGLPTLTAGHRRVVRRWWAARVASALGFVAVLLHLQGWPPGYWRVDPLPRVGRLIDRALAVLSSAGRRLTSPG